MNNLTIELKITMDSQLANLLTALIGGAKPKEIPATQKEVIDEPKEGTPEPEEEAPKDKDRSKEPKGDGSITMEMLRAKGAELSRAGKQAELKKAFATFGAAKLSGVPEENFGELMALLEEV